MLLLESFALCQCVKISIECYREYKQYRRDREERPRQFVESLADNFSIFGESDIKRSSSPLVHMAVGTC